MKRLLALLLVVFIYTAQAQTTTQKGGHCFTMDLPNYFVKTWDLNDAASLQYQSTVKDAYVVVIEDDKEHLASVGMKFNNPTEFLNSFTEDYMKEVKTRKFTPVTTFEANGNKHAQTELTWTDEDGSYYMLITVTETNGHFYKTMCWTSAKNKAALKQDFVNLSKSIRD